MVDAKTKLKKNPSARYIPYSKFLVGPGPCTYITTTTKYRLARHGGEGETQDSQGDGSNMVRLTFYFFFLFWNKSV